MSEVSKPKSDTLSRAELILDLNDAFAVAIEAVARQDTKDRLDQALKQIKALLQPVPEEKLGELVDEWASDLFESIWVSPECLGSDELANEHFTLWGNKLLKEYEKEKEREE